MLNFAIGGQYQNVNRGYHNQNHYYNSPPKLYKSQSQEQGPAKYLNFRNIYQHDHHIVNPIYKNYTDDYVNNTYVHTPIYNSYGKRYFSNVFHLPPTQHNSYRKPQYFPTQHYGTPYKGGTLYGQNNTQNYFRQQPSTYSMLS